MERSIRTPHNDNSFFMFHKDINILVIFYKTKQPEKFWALQKNPRNSGPLKQPQKFWVFRHSTKMWVFQTILGILISQNNPKNVESSKQILNCSCDSLFQNSTLKLFSLCAVIIYCLTPSPLIKT